MTFEELILENHGSGHSNVEECNALSVMDE